MAGWFTRAPPVAVIGLDNPAPLESTSKVTETLAKEIPAHVARMLEFDQSPEWKLHSANHDGKGVDIYFCKDASGQGATKGILRGVKVAPAWICRLLADFDIVKNYDPAFIGGRLIEPRVTTDAGFLCEIDYLAYRSPAPLLVSNRDLLTFSFAGKASDTTWISGNVSCDHPAVQPQPGYVRALLAPLGCMLVRVNADDPATSDLTYVLALNPGGAIPAWVAAAISTDQPMVLAAMKPYAEKRYREEQEASGTGGASASTA